MNNFLLGSWFINIATVIAYIPSDKVTYFSSIVRKVNKKNLKK